MRVPTRTLPPARLGPIATHLGTFHKSTLLSSSRFSARLPISCAGSRQRRAFHVGPYIQSSCDVAQDIIVSLHSITGLPWAFTIPLVALGINLLFRAPFNYHTQILQQRRSKVAPVLQGWFRKLWGEAVREKVPPDQIKKVVEKRAKTQVKRIHGVLGLQQWKAFYVLAGIPIWLVSLEAIRRLCGWGRWDTMLNAGPDPAAKSSAAGTVEGLAVSPDLSRDGLSSVAGTMTDLPALDAVTVADLSSSASQISSASQNLDPTLTTEGLLWFSDLTASDPYYILPLTWLGLTVLNLIPRDEAARRAFFGRLYPHAATNQDNKAPSSLEPPATETVQLGGDVRVRTIRALTFASPLLLYYIGDFPAAMHLYTISSVVTTMAFRSLLARRYPEQARVKMCKHREMSIIRPEIPRTTPITAGEGKI